MRRTLLAALFVPAALAAQEPYKRPPAVVEKILDAPRTPALIPSPDDRLFLLAEPIGQPSAGELAQPMHRLAGLRINGITNGPHQAKAGTPANFRGLVI